MTIAIALPWDFGAAGGVNEVVRNLIIHQLEHNPGRRIFLVSSSSDTQVEVSPGISVANATLPLFDPPFGRSVRPWASFIFKAPWRVHTWKRFLEREGVSELHIHPGGLAALSAAVPAAAMLKRRPKVSVSFHGFDVQEARIGSMPYKAAFRSLLARVDAINACSSWLAEQLAASDLVPRSRIRVCHNGIDPGTLEAELADTVSMELPTKPYVLCVATYEHKKGIDLLVDAFGRFGDMHPDVQLVIAGRPGDSADALRQQVRRSPLSDRIHLIGETPHAKVMTLMRHATLLVLPSRQEPFGIVLLEAAFVGCPTVATRVGGVPEVIVDEETGLLASANDVASLSNKIDRLLQDPDLAARLSSRARERTLTSFTWQHRAERYLTFEP